MNAAATGDTLALFMASAPAELLVPKRKARSRFVRFSMEISFLICDEIVGLRYAAWLFGPARFGVTFFIAGLLGEQWMGRIGMLSAVGSSERGTSSGLIT